MNKYTVLLSEQAEKDIDKLSDTIAYDFQAPLTEYRYMQGLIDTILALEISPETYQIQTGSYFYKFGASVRKVNYKKMVIIYTVHQNIVYIHRIIASSMITE